VRIATQQPPGASRPLLLINGMAARLQMWRPFVAALPARHLVMFDLPGIGGGLSLRVPELMPAIAQWLTDLLDVMEIDEADVLGYSWGGVLAQQFARDAPDRLHRLVLTSTNHGWGGVPVPLLPLWNPLPNSTGDDLGKLVAAAFGADPNSSNAFAAILTAFNPQKSSFSGQFRQLYSTMGWTSLPWLHTLKAPTLVVAGDDDPFVPISTSRTISDTIPDARLELIPGGGHLIPTNQPSRLARSVDNFLNESDC